MPLRRNKFSDPVEVAAEAAHKALSVFDEAAGNLESAIALLQQASADAEDSAQRQLERASQTLEDARKHEVVLGRIRALTS